MTSDELRKLMEKIEALDYDSGYVRVEMPQELPKYLPKMLAVVEEANEVRHRSGNDGLDAALQALEEA